MAETPDRTGRPARTSVAPTSAEVDGARSWCRSASSPASAPSSPSWRPSTAFTAYEEAGTVMLVLAAGLSFTCGDVPLPAAPDSSATSGHAGPTHRTPTRRCTCRTPASGRSGSASAPSSSATACSSASGSWCPAALRARSSASVGFVRQSRAPVADPGRRRRSRDGVVSGSPTARRSRRSPTTRDLRSAVPSRRQQLDAQRVGDPAERPAGRRSAANRNVHSTALTDRPKVVAMTSAAPPRKQHDVEAERGHAEGGADRALARAVERGGARRGRR